MMNSVQEHHSGRVRDAERFVQAIAKGRVLILRLSSFNWMPDQAQKKSVGVRVGKPLQDGYGPEMSAYRVLKNEEGNGEYSKDDEQDNISSPLEGSRH